MERDAFIDGTVYTHTYIVDESILYRNNGNFMDEQRREITKRSMKQSIYSIRPDGRHVQDRKMV